jgi:hypothetical protein
MGTSGAWTGTAGVAWNRVRNQLDDLLDNPSRDGAEELLSPLLDAIDHDDGQEPADSAPDAPPTPQAPMPTPPAAAGGPRIRPRGGGRGGGGGGAVFGGSSGQNRGRKGRSRRSSARASRVAGNVLAAGLALGRGDAGALRDLGLDLAELRGLSPMKQAQKILNVLVGTGGAVEENELRAANARALRQLLVEGLSGADAVRVFVVEYVMQIYSSECGEASRNGTRPGQDSAEVERQLRSALKTRVGQLDVPDDTVTSARLTEVIGQALKTMRKVRPR